MSPRYKCVDKNMLHKFPLQIKQPVSVFLVHSNTDNPTLWFMLGFCQSGKKLQSDEDVFNPKTTESTEPDSTT